MYVNYRRVQKYKKKAKFRAHIQLNIVNLHVKEQMPPE